MRKAAALASFTLATLIVSAAIVACSSDTPTTFGGGKTDAAVVEQDARNPYPSFRDDVVPIVQASCSLTACHASKESNLGIFLAYDTAQIYGELQKTSPTAAGEKFVVAGDPAKSYLMVKLEGKQADLAAKCAAGSCGTEMPPENKLPADKLDTIRKWITAGAKND